MAMGDSEPTAILYPHNQFLTNRAIFILWIFGYVLMSEIFSYSVTFKGSGQLGRLHTSNKAV